MSNYYLNILNNTVLDEGLGEATLTYRELLKLFRNNYDKTYLPFELELVEALADGKSILGQGGSSIVDNYRPKHFVIEDFVPPSVLARYGKEKAWTLLDNRLVWTIDKIREALGREITINTWHKGGPFKERGYRDPKSSTGAPRSLHKQGKAVDFDAAGMTAEQVRSWIRANYRKLDCLKYITAMERNVTWVHIDLRPYDRDKLGLFEFSP